jgi:ubiquinone/menaquinone biosynthesis C-methylase UbiE
MIERSRAPHIVPFLGAWLVLVMLAGRVQPQVVAPAPTQPAGRAAEAQAPPAPTHYRGRQIAQTMHYEGAPWLVRDSRQREEDCQRLLAELTVKAGDVVCDMGCGNGFYTLKLADLVGAKGKVYAVDVQPEMLRLLGRRAKQAGAKNIVPVLGTAVDPRLPAGQMDLVLLVDVYHEFSHPEQMLSAIRRSLKPGGRVALAEFRAEDPEVPIQALHKMSKEQILREFSPNGLKLRRQFDGLPWQHLMFFGTDPAAPGRAGPQGR